MELLFFIFIAFILLVIILSGSSEVKKTIKEDYTENFKMYFYSLPEERQKCFNNNLDYIHKLQFEDYMKSEDNVIPEFFINEFNNWAKNKDNEIEPFNLNNYGQTNSITYDDNSFNDCNFRNEENVFKGDNEITFQKTSDTSNNDNNLNNRNI